MNGNGHSEDIEKNRGLYHPLAESAARDCYAPGVTLHRLNMKAGLHHQEQERFITIGKVAQVYHNNQTMK